MKPDDPVLDQLLARGRLAPQAREDLLQRVLERVRRAGARVVRRRRL